MRHTENIHPPLAHSHLAGIRTFVQTDAVVQSGSYDFDGRQVFQIGTVHLRTDVTYMLLDFPNALSRTSLTAEQTDVAGIRLRIVRTYQTEQSGLARTVLTAQCPLLPTHHRPVQFFQNRTVTVADTDFVQPDHFVRSKVRVFVRKTGNALLQFAQRSGIRLNTEGILFTESLQVGCTRHFLSHCFIVNRNYVGNKRRYIIQHGKYQYDLQGSKLRQLLQDSVQQLARSSIQSDERVIHDKDTRIRKQRLGQLELTEFSAGKENNLLAQHRFDTEKLKQLLSERLVLYLAQQVAHQRSIFLVVCIPTLLVVIIGIGGTVGVTKSDVLDVVVSGLCGGRTEIVYQRTVAQGILARKQIDQQTFSCPVRAYNSDMFAVEKIKGHGIR